MKKSKILLLSILTLTMVGCNNRTSSDTSTTDDQISTTTSSVATSEKESSTVLTTSDTTSSTSSSSSISSSDPTDVGWNDDIRTAMLKYLGGQVIPYMECGYRSTVDWITNDKEDYGHLEIYGKKKYSTEFETQAKASLEADGYTPLTSALGVKYENTTKKLTVLIINDKDGDSNGYILIKVTYDEPYDNTVTSSWESDVSSLMTSTFGETIPYFYMGNKFPVASLNTSYQSGASLQISGGKYSDQFLTDAKTTLTSLNATITIDDGNMVKATYTSTLGTYTFTFLKANKGSNTGEGVYLCRLNVNFDENWNPTGNSWSTDVSDMFSSMTDGHEIPYFYIGKKVPTVSSSNQNQFTIYGGKWNDGVINECKTAITNSNNSFTSSTSSAETEWVIQSESDTAAEKIVAKKIFSDKCYITFTLEKLTDDIAILVKYGKAYVSEMDDWPSSVKNYFDSALDGHSLPFVWMGSTSVNASKNTWGTEYLSIYTYSSFNSEIVPLYKSAFEADGWTSSTLNSKQLDAVGSYYQYVVYTKTMSDKCVLTVALKDESNSSYSYSTYMYAFIEETFEEPTGENAKYPDAILNDFKSYFTYTENETSSYEEFPYVYLGSNKPTGQYNSTDKSYKITGGNYKDEVVDLAKAKFSDSTWTLTESTDSDNNKVLKGTSSVNHGHNFEFELCSLNSKATLTIKYIESYDESKFTSWSTGDSTNPGTNYLINTNLGLSIPNFYLGTVNETATYTSNYNQVKIVGGNYNSQIITNAYNTLNADATNNQYDTNSTLTSASWVMNYDLINGQKALKAVKTLSNGDHIRIKVFKQSSYVDFINVEIYLDIHQTASTTTSWSDDDKTALNAATGLTDAIPFFDVGGDYRIMQNQGDSYCSFRMYNYKNYYTYQIKDILVNDGWTIYKFDEFYNEYGAWLRAYKEVSGRRIDINIKAGGNPSFYIYSTSLYQKKGSEGLATEWNDETKEKMNGYLGEVLPYFDLGKYQTGTTSSYSGGSTALTMSGSSYSDEMFADLTSIFTTSGYSTSTFHSNGSEVKFMASKDSSIYSSKKVYVEITVKFNDYSTDVSVSSYLL